MARHVLPLAAACLLTASCTLGPDYQRPPIESPEKWRQSEAEQASLADVAWWDLFQDEALRELITVALRENRDLRVAVERIEEARAFYGISRSALYPRIDLNGVGGGLRISEGSLTHLPEGTGSDNSVDLYNIGLGLSWELDFFGRVRRANEAEMALLLATEEARRAITISLVAEVAGAYVELRELDNRLAITRSTLESRREYIGLARDRFEGGITPEVDFRQAEAELHRVEALVFATEKLLAQKENELSFLLGNPPGDIARGGAEWKPLPPSVPAGLPSELLDRRPDIRSAEQELVAANARIGEAKALLFPTISLTGAFGFASQDLGDIADSDSRSGNLFAGLLQPIFNAGANRRRVEVTESQQRQAVYEYENTILQAFREVEDSLVALQKNGQEREAQSLRVAAERKVVELSELRYRGGVAAYLEVLDAQRSLFDAEIDEVSSASEHLGSWIELYKALGGGWTPPEEATDDAAAPATNAALAPAAPPIEPSMR
jgi:multidrug efflux system outer membrane protein